MKSQILDHCWVCGIRFTDSNPPGSANKELHHVVPRAFGGLDGPIVSLCDSCHSKVHKLTAKNIDYSILNGLDKQAQSKLQYLASVIKSAGLMANSDVNKLFPISFKITRKESEVLDKLKIRYSLSSRAAVYKLALQKLVQSIAP